MTVDDKLLKHVAQTARLNLTKEEEEEFLPQLSEVLEAFHVLDEVDVENIEPSFQPVPIGDATADDEEAPCLSQEQALAQTSHKKDGYF